MSVSDKPRQHTTKFPPHLTLADALRHVSVRELHASDVRLLGRDAAQKRVLELLQSEAEHVTVIERLRAELADAKADITRLKRASDDQERSQ